MYEALCCSSPPDQPATARIFEDSNGRLALLEAEFKRTKTALGETEVEMSMRELKSRMADEQHEAAMRDLQSRCDQQAARLTDLLAQQVRF